jgi:hypothetical protein
MVEKRNLLHELIIKVERESYPDGRTGLLLRQYNEDIRTFNELIDTKPKEAQIQSYLEEHPVILLHAMLDGFYPAASTRSALFPKIALGNQYEVDFAYCNGNSMGVWWTFVELERADVPLFTKAGDPTRYLTHAIRQVLDWQAWVVDHSEYACSELEKLTQGDPYIYDCCCGQFRRPCNAVIVIGRRVSLSPKTNRRRIQLCTEIPRLEIITYDRLFDKYDVDKEEDLDGAKDKMRNVREISI